MGSVSNMRPSRYATPSNLPPVDVAGVITLDQVRLQPRKQNEYVDTPRSPIFTSGKSLSQCGGGSKPLVANLAPRERVILPNRTPTTQSIIRNQPISTSPPLKKDLPLEVTRLDDTIICSKCGKCRCGACTGDRKLPPKYLCGDKVNVSPDTVVEYATCLCCVKGMFYHCSKDDQDAEFECSSDPCAGCSRPHCCKRWTCILAMTLCLPCMCLYPPAKLALMCCTSCYNRCRKKGCQCTSSSQQKHKTKFDSQYRGLLIESDRESSSVS